MVMVTMASSELLPFSNFLRASTAFDDDDDGDDDDDDDKILASAPSLRLTRQRPKARS